ncbi:type II secretion system F family protein [Ferrimonas sediminicola]|uniref:Type II secretion system F family protein n=1 Tax=Ferrimonas sediminicola TaxID=2569538 RepID=A0A4U1BG80_9GAMM|nr:type II secretion system F family protein [Ferrimonas sediminicola]TKB49960.1 type II secretion system F family protein [Ferrimonas sediminicola]
MEYLLNLINEQLNNPTYSLYVVYGIAAAAGVTLAIGVGLLLSGLYSPTRKRLAQLKMQEGPQVAMGQDFDESLEHGLTGKKHQKLIGHFTFGNDDTRKRLIHAGFHSNSALAVYNGCRILLFIAVTFGSMLLLKAFPDASRIMLFYGVALMMGGAFILPSAILDNLASRRMRKLKQGFPDALDLLVVCCEAGLGLLAALNRVATEIRLSHFELAEELNLVCQKCRAGLQVSVALKEFADRTGLEDIQGLNGSITQSMRLGTGIAETLRVYSEEYRDKRIQAAEEMAGKLGVKMMFPMIFCIWPSFFIVAIGPAMLKLMEVWDVAF